MVKSANFSRRDVSHILLTWLGVSLVSSAFGLESDETQSVSPRLTLVWGPGLHAGFAVPVKYFYIHAVDTAGENFTESAGEKAFEVSVIQSLESRTRVYVQVLDRHDGSYIARYKPFSTYKDVTINVLHNGQHVAQSPYTLPGTMYHENCYCPQKISTYLKSLECPTRYKQIKQDLSIFQDVDADEVAEEAISRFSNKGMHSLCHYRIINNKIYRKTHGQHVGFKMFSDAILLSLTRKVKLPDIDFFVNLGDWPLEKRKVSENPLPIFSWCGSEDTRDIVMPTYDITEATLQAMNRVSLDMMTVQSNTGPEWDNKSTTALWRGRDSRQERLDLVMMSRKHPEIIDAKLTNMFFFPKDEEKYGEIVKSISFFDFFKYKYQINIDGTVAAYRFPYLLMGNSLVLKQQSPYYEHFYKMLEANKHYVPFRRDLDDLMEKIQWAKDNDEKAKSIAKQGQQFARENLMPRDIFCYHTMLFREFSKLLKTAPKPPDEGWELVEQPDDREAQCDCPTLVRDHKQKKRDEL